MEEKSFSEFLYGKDYVNRQKKFDEGIEAIEQNHIDFFKERESKFPDEEHDKLNYHFIIKYDGHTITIGFKKDTDIPQNIQDEVLELFYKVWDTSEDHK